jgi:membrane-associated protease RseP (regulator of RpoE activity)
LSELQSSLEHRQPPVAGSPQSVPPSVPTVRRRRVGLPVLLFLLTCLSTFWVGTIVEPNHYIFALVAGDGQAQLIPPLRRVLLLHYGDGLRYMLAVLGILFAHEMGHFLATVRYRVPASLPFFLPLPITPIGTLGAVIGIDGSEADRKQIFDIGLAGPLAGLVVAIPVMWYGVVHLELQEANGLGGLRLQAPLGVSLMLQASGVELDRIEYGFWLGHLQGNPYFIAGWVGFLITGLNMLPVSQLDGGHVLYCLFGRWAHWLARLFMLVVVIYILAAKAYVWIPMALLVYLLMGTDHPPTRDDSVRLGGVRTLLGFVSLAIPVFCLPLPPFEL